MFQRLLGLCFSLLAAAVAIYVAVRLIESVLGVLIIIVAVIGVSVAAGALWRRRNTGGW